MFHMNSDFEFLMHKRTQDTGEEFNTNGVSRVNIVKGLDAQRMHVKRSYKYQIMGKYVTTLWNSQDEFNDWWHVELFIEWRIDGEGTN